MKSVYMMERPRAPKTGTGKRERAVKTVWALQSPLFPDAPPIFLLCATDDEPGFPAHVISLYNRWFEAKHSAGMHLFARGGHGFGSGTKKNTTGNWIDQFMNWLGSEGFM
jgi:acetyl esterase/lipase